MMPRDTDRPDPYIAAPLGPPIRQAAPAPAPAPSKQPQPGAMDVSDIGMIMRDCTPKPAKPTKLNEQQRADWLRMREGPVSFDVHMQVKPPTEEEIKTRERVRAQLLEALSEMYGDTAPELHPRRHLDWPVIDPDIIEQAPRRRAAWLPEGE